MMERATRLIRKRPVASILATTTVSITSYASFKEWKSQQRPLNYYGSTDSVQTDLKHLKQEQDVQYNVLPRSYDRDLIAQYWQERPITVVQRVGNICYELLPIVFSYIYDFHILPKVNKILNDSLSIENIAKDDDYETISDIQKLQIQHAQNLRNVFTRLGPAFIKFGQQLSIRPDLLPAPVLFELQKLCDKVEPIPDEIAIDIIKQDLGPNILHSFVDDKITLVAAASLGQVYKATLKKNHQEIAIKVQRPDMLEKVSLDLFLLANYGAFLDEVFDKITNQVPFHVAFIDCFARGSYSELDYEKEAQNQMFFKNELSKRKSKVHIPAVYSDMTSQRIITTEWINGVKLVDAPKNKIKELIPVGVELFLTQLLDIGAFHSDPHPGNLLVTEKGDLCLLDFGLCAEIDTKSRQAMTKAIVHLLSGDFDSLIAQDAKDLGFLPYDLDITEIKPILTKILSEGLLGSGSDLHKRKRNLMNISNELNEVFFRYPFSVPPFFALVTRGLGLLEGIALSGDPNFDIFQASYPYARHRAAKIYGDWRRLRRSATKMI